MVEDFTWVITRLDAVNTLNMNISLMPSRQWLSLNGYCKTSGLKKHEYGPFKTMDSLLSFALEKKLQIDE